MEPTNPVQLRHVRVVIERHTYLLTYDRRRYREAWLEVNRWVVNEELNMDEGMGAIINEKIIEDGKQ